MPTISPLFSSYPFQISLTCLCRPFCNVHSPVFFQICFKNVPAEKTVIKHTCRLSNFHIFIASNARFLRHLSSFHVFFIIAKNIRFSSITKHEKLALFMQILSSRSIFRFSAFFPKGITKFYNFSFFPVNFSICRSSFFKFHSISSFSTSRSVRSDKFSKLFRQNAELSSLRETCVLR